MPEWLPARTSPRKTTGRPGMSRISDNAVVRELRLSCWFHSSEPLAADKATSSPDEKAATTVSPARAGEEAARMRAGSMRAWYFQPGAPVTASKVSS